MNHEVWLWVALAAYAIHVLEEFMFDWKGWANHVLRLPVDWPGFYVTNAVVAVLGIVVGQVGWRLPAIALAFPALMLINAVFFHIVPFVVTRKFSPGLITAIALFLPLGIFLFVGAHEDGVLTTANSFGAFVIGAALMACPVVMLKVKDRPFFQQECDLPTVALASSNSELPPASLGFSVGTFVGDASCRNQLGGLGSLVAPLPSDR
jgi:hypothetical protein